MTSRKGTKGGDLFVASSDIEAFDGVQGYDIVTYASSISGIRIDLGNPSTNLGDAAGDTYKNIDAFRLTTSDDVFIGSAGNDVVNGDAGNDVLEGRNGNDALTGHSGNDTIYGGDGADSIWGGGNDDVLFGGTGNDQIWGDANNDVITGGADGGTFSMSAITEKFYKYSADILIPLSQIDDVGEWVVVPKRQALVNASNATSLNRAEGDAIFVVTNGYNDARDWNAVRGNGPVIDLGPNGRIDGHTSIVFNAGPGPGNSAVRFTGSSAGAPNPKAPGSNPEGVVNVVTGYKVGTVNFGDVITGGSSADTFVFGAGDGVDKITDFQIGVDHLDLTNTWFDGVASNGEFSVRDFNGGALLLFSDTSADGFVDNTAVYLANVHASDVNASLFI